MAVQETAAQGDLRQPAVRPTVLVGCGLDAYQGVADRNVRSIAPVVRAAVPYDHTLNAAASRRALRALPEHPAQHCQGVFTDKLNSSAPLLG